MPDPIISVTTPDFVADRTDAKWSRVTGTGFDPGEVVTIIARNPLQAGIGVWRWGGGVADANGELFGGPAFCSGRGVVVVWPAPFGLGPPEPTELQIIALGKVRDVVLSATISWP